MGLIIIIHGETMDIIMDMDIISGVLTPITIPLISMHLETEMDIMVGIIAEYTVVLPLTHPIIAPDLQEVQII